MPQVQEHITKSLQKTLETTKDIVEHVKRNPLVQIEAIKKFNVQKQWDSNKNLVISKAEPAEIQIHQNEPKDLIEVIDNQTDKEIIIHTTEPNELQEVVKNPSDLLVLGETDTSLTVHKEGPKDIAVVEEKNTGLVVPKEQPKDLAKLEDK